MTDLIPVTAPMPFELEYRARIMAARLRISRAELVRRAVVDYLDRIDAGQAEAGNNGYEREVSKRAR
jgi:hypothetical protein